MERIATIGVFDGVHSGHRHLLNQLISEANSRGGSSMVVTFYSHPRSVVADESVFLLTPDDEKTDLLRQLGIQDVYTILFNSELANMSAREFMIQILRDSLHVDVLVIGYDHRFGKGRVDGFDDYVRYGHELGIKVIPSVAYAPDGNPVSSSRIRQCLSRGEVDDANDMLGYKYKLRGKVVGGHRRGRLLGYPTANLMLNPRKFIPRDGVYATRVFTKYGPAIGMLNIGTNPTFDCNVRTVEVHLLDFEHDLYDCMIDVELHDYVREEIHFERPSDLASQISMDEQTVRKIIND